MNALMLIWPLPCQNLSTLPRAGEARFIELGKVMMGEGSHAWKGRGHPRQSGFNGRPWGEEAGSQRNCPQHIQMNLKGTVPPSPPVQIESWLPKCWN